MVVTFGTMTDEERDHAEVRGASEPDRRPRRGHSADDMSAIGRGVSRAGGKIHVGKNQFTFAPLPDKLLGIIRNKGLVNWIKKAE